MKYITCKDLDVVGSLEVRDFFYGERTLNGQKKVMKYRVNFPPKYFSHSGNWTLRVSSRNLNQELGIDTHENFTEFLYINVNNIHKFLFSADTVSKYNRNKQLTEFVNNNNKTKS